MKENKNNQDTTEAISLAATTPLQLFNNSEYPEFGTLRVLTINNEPWFVGKDVAIALGYKNTRQGLSTNVEFEDKGVHSVDTPSGKQQMTIINESGLYSLILVSKLESAKKFKHWVTSEVLPSIRKHGMYATEDLLNNPDLAIKAFTALKEEREKTDRNITGGMLLLAVSAGLISNKQVRQMSGKAISAVGKSLLRLKK